MTDTIAGRSIIVILFGLGTILGLAHFLYQKGIEQEIAHGNSERLADRLILLSNTITTLDASARDEAAHRLSGGPLELHWARDPLATPGGALDDATIALRDRLIARLPSPAADRLIVLDGGLYLWVNVFQGLGHFFRGNCHWHTYFVHFLAHGLNR